jgi:hypothetical protein
MSFYNTFKEYSPMVSNNLKILQHSIKDLKDKNFTKNLNRLPDLARYSCLQVRPLGSEHQSNLLMTKLLTKLKNKNYSKKKKNKKKPNYKKKKKKQKKKPESKKKKKKKPNCKKKRNNKKKNKKKKQKNS